MAAVRAKRRQPLGKNRGKMKRKGNKASVLAVLVRRSDRTVVAVCHGLLTGVVDDLRLWPMARRMCGVLWRLPCPLPESY
mgnify:FL=1